MSHFPISENSKTALRKTAVEIRNKLPMPEISRQVNGQIESWPIFQKTEIILFYSAFRNEIDLLPLAEQYADKQWYLPKVEPGETLGFYRYAPQALLTPGSYGVLEPVSEERFTPAPTSTQVLILVPGLMFDRKGYRLGYGKGYYDRFLQGLHKQNITYISMGAVPDALHTGELPSESHDIPVTWLVTESVLRRV